MAAMTSIALAAMAVGTGISAYSSYEQGKTAKEVSAFNAAEQRQEARRVQSETSREASRMQANKARSLATIRALFAKSGLDFSGSPMEAMAEKSFLLDLEISDMQRRGSGQSTRLNRQAGLTERYGRKQYKAGVIGAGTDILGGLSSIGLQTGNMNVG